MKTSMSIIVFFVTFIAVFVASMAETINREEDCIRRNIARSQQPSLSAEPTKRSTFYFLADQFCRKASRVIMFYVRLNGKFPSYYVKTLCNVFGNDDKKVKEYVVERWVEYSKLASALTCVSH
ncbi:PREDICTED: uncharacterized protein LOC104772600 [Camelina sativa]|uniref:Uncharacterized protein LOC104772600 n=1 Tax=Camelina sativa TaxID=90675 RepID=A0ABM0Y4T2_CAMSA|nr:PREDICTED: uncharacterized protein LOC104772600 [Camelina sativa]